MEQDTQQSKEMSHAQDTLQHATLQAAPQQDNKGKRGAGRRLNDHERMEIIDIMAKEPKTKNVDLAKRYGVSEGAIRKLKQIKDTIRERYMLGNEHNRDKRKRGGFRRNAQFEHELFEWICRMRETQAYQLIPLTQTAVRQHAIVLATKYEKMATFKASPGWFARFCSRHRLDPPMVQVRDMNVMATADADVAAMHANEMLLATSHVMNGTPKQLDSSRSHEHPVNVDASMPIVLAFQPTVAVTALQQQSFEVNVDEQIHAAVTVAATAASAAVSTGTHTLAQVPPAPAAAIVSTTTVVHAALPPIIPSTVVDLSCAEAIAEDHTVATESVARPAPPAATAVASSMASVASVSSPKIEPLSTPPPVFIIPRAPPVTTRSIYMDDDIFSMGL